jgi:hypothetical protein
MLTSQNGWLRELSLPSIERVLPEAEPLRNLREGITPLSDLRRCIVLEIVAEIAGPMMASLPQN